MSLLIKGMEMPEIKENKSIKAEIRNLDGRLELGIMTGGYYCCEQRSYYPIIEVPDGHGRLIDADALFKEMEHNGWFDNADRDIAEDLVLDAPTVIPASEEEKP